MLVYFHSERGECVFGLFFFEGAAQSVTDLEAVFILLWFEAVDELVNLFLRVKRHVTVFASLISQLCLGLKLHEGGSLATYNIVFYPRPGQTSVHFLLGCKQLFNFLLLTWPPELFHSDSTLQSTHSGQVGWRWNHISTASEFIWDQTQTTSSKWSVQLFWSTPERDYCVHTSSIESHRGGKWTRVWFNWTECLVSVSETNKALYCSQIVFFHKNLPQWKPFTAIMVKVKGRVPAGF